MPHFQRLIARATDSFTEVIAYYLTILAVSGLLFSYFEDKPLFESFWWAIVTGLTIDWSGSYAAGFWLAAGVTAFGAIWWAFVLPKIRLLDFD